DPTNNSPAPSAPTASVKVDSGDVVQVTYTNSAPANQVVSGHKFVDLDADGTRDAGEPGLDGVTIHIVGKTWDGVSINTSTTTGVNPNNPNDHGYWEFN